MELEIIAGAEAQNFSYLPPSDNGAMQQGTNN